MDRFHQIQVYVAVAEEQGFAAAARRLQLSPPAVTRAVAALEETLGVKLLNRTTRYVRATEAGQRYLEDARQILARLESADEAAAGINAEPRGHLAVTAPALFGRKFVMPGIVDYLQRYPEMEARVEALGPFLVLVVMAYPGGPMTAVFWASGLTTMAFLPFAAAVLAGGVVRSFLYSLFGSTLIEGFSAQFLWISLVMAAVFLLPLCFARVRQLLGLSRLRD